MSSLNEALFWQVVEELEALDAHIRKHGITDALKTRWGVTTNTGTWNAGRHTVEYLDQLIRDRQPQHIVELGTSVGYTALWLGRAAASYGGEVSTIECESYKHHDAVEHIDRVGLQDIITPILGRNVEVLTAWQTPIDFLFIDAGKREYLQDFTAAEPHLGNDALIVADNINDFKHATQPFITFMQENANWDVQIRNIDHGLLIATKNRT